MLSEPSKRDLQVEGCVRTTQCVDTSKKPSQNAAAASGILEAATNAMRRFPEDKAILVTCTQAVAMPILFNRENGLRAGRLGALNLTLAGYRKWMDDPSVTCLGGAIGSFLDWCNENRAILRELGGVHMLIQNIKNNFHGNYSNWAYEPVKQSLFGLSSGCWRNQDICFKEGFVPLSVQLMTEHTRDSKIAEETLQAVKALMKYSNEYRLALGEAGLAKAMVKVLRENPTDRGAVSLACHTLAMFVGPTRMDDPYGSDSTIREFDPKLQALADEAGAMEELISLVMAKAKLQHHEHGGFNFNIDEAYNAQADCLSGLRAMVKKNVPNQQKIVNSGLMGELVGRWQQGTLNPRARKEACDLSQYVSPPDLPGVKKTLCGML